MRLKKNIDIYLPVLIVRPLLLFLVSSSSLFPPPRLLSLLSNPPCLLLSRVSSLYCLLNLLSPIVPFLSSSLVISINLFLKAFAHSFVVCMASGAVEECQKFYFYAEEVRIYEFYTTRYIKMVYFCKFSISLLRKGSTHLHRT